ncbi:MAG TPA: gamma-glutamyltransferase, partial [Devosia sp.]|nr:gamma-glutamyltransferase [Devosia sp.]
MVQRSEWRIAKTQVSSQEGVVATMYTQASEAGAEMLKRGGNAIDAAVAAAFTIGVVEPFNSGLGGVAVMAYHEASSGKTYILDGTGPLPMASRPDQFAAAGTGAKTGVYGWPEIANDANNTGFMTPAVPGMPALVLEAQARFGRLTRADVTEAAIHHAENGYPIDWYIALGMAVNQHRLHLFPESRRTFFREDGTCYRAPMLGVEGDNFRQPELARSLRAIAADGADAFYRGRIAEMIAEDMARNGGLLSYDDLAGYRLRESEVGLRTEYHGHELIGGLENTGVPTVLGTLNMLEQFNLSQLEPGSVE